MVFRGGNGGVPLQVEIELSSYNIIPQIVKNILKVTKMIAIAK